MSKVLVLAAGRRRYVVEALQSAMPAGSALFVSDREEAMPGLSVVGTQGVIEPSEASDFASWLLDLCEQESIRGVLSLHDFQTTQVSELREQLASIGTMWIGPGPDVATTMLDKSLLAEYLQQRGGNLAIPTYGPGDSLPDGESVWVIKDRMGSGSSGLVLNASPEAAQEALETGGVIVQPHVSGEEWNLDFFFWGGGVIRGISAKRKLRMRAGETDAAQVMPSRSLPLDVEPVVDAFRDLDHLGNIDIDVFVDATGIKVVDVNPRFGGGYAFSAMAGYAGAEAVWALVDDAVPFAVEAKHSFTGAKSIEVVKL